MLTRGRAASATITELRVQLKNTLQELKAKNQLCEQLQAERTESEEEIIKIITTNTNLKKQLSQMEQELKYVIDEREELQKIINSYDNGQDIHIETLRTNAQLKKQLVDVHQQIANEQNLKVQQETKETLNLYHELVAKDSPSNNNPLTNSEHSIYTTPRLRISRKHSKISSLIRKTKRKVQISQKSLLASSKKDNDSDLSHQLLLCQQQLTINKNEYEENMTHLHLRIRLLQASLEDLAANYSSAQSEISDLQARITEFVNTSVDESPVTIVQQCPTAPSQASQLDKIDQAGSQQHSPGNTIPTRVTNRASKRSSTVTSIYDWNERENIYLESMARSQQLDTSHEQQLSPEQSIPTTTRSRPVSSTSSALDSGNPMAPVSSNPSTMASGDPIAPENHITYIFSDKIGQGLGPMMLDECINHQVINICMPGASYTQLVQHILNSGSYSKCSTIILLVGNCKGVKQLDIINCLESLNQLHVKKIITCAFPFMGPSSKGRNVYINRLNQLMCNVSGQCDSNVYLDINSFISDFRQTKDSLYLANYYTEQLAMYIAFNILYDPVIGSMTVDSNVPFSSNTNINIDLAKQCTYDTGVSNFCQYRQRVCPT